ncbi:hypothetical protein MSPP1_001667 [Malassezia sp. CBS 17886]|nr:hypothetical protein MSPP1_001667 [Malassezia sp. CBS 17886]
MNSIGHLRVGAEMPGLATMMASLFGLVVVLLVILFLNQLVLSLWRMTIGEWFSPWRHIPKVKSTDNFSFFFGDFRAIRDAAPGEMHVKWMKELGPVYRYRHFFSMPRVIITDPKGLQHMFSPSMSYQYPKPSYISGLLRAVLGEGLVTIEGQAHARQRKIIAPAFSPGAVRQFEPVIHRHADLLVDKLRWAISLETARRTGEIDPDTEIVGQAPPDRTVKLAHPEHAAVVNVHFWLNRSTLDVIGQVGFSTDFESLERGDQHPFTEAMVSLVNTVLENDTLQILRMVLSEKSGFGWLRNIPTQRSKKIRNSQVVVQTHAKEIVDRMRDEILAEHVTSKEAFDEWGGSDKLKPKSLISRMIRANMAEGLKPSERMSDEEVMGQMTTLIIAGHETTATQNTWALWLLAQHQDVQDWLRGEVRAAAARHAAECTDLADGEYRPPFDVSAIPYLENVVRECIRVLPSVSNTMRVALKDDVVPLSRAYPRTDGKGSFSEVVIPKGTDFFVTLNTMQFSKELWGEDADEFRPDRWDNLPGSVTDAKMPPGNTFAFLSGPRSCVGKQLAVLETQVYLAHLVQHFKFDVVPDWKMVQRQQAVLRGFVEGQKEYGFRVPLIMTPVAT